MASDPTFPSIIAVSHLRYVICTGRCWCLRGCLSPLRELSTSVLSFTTFFDFLDTTRLTTSITIELPISRIQVTQHNAAHSGPHRRPDHTSESSSCHTTDC